jgi:hypothetical protein
MADYSFSQLESLWIGAGGPKLVAPIAAAIALAESSGNPQATNATDNGGTQTSWGLWQISNGTHNQPVANILNPQINAQQAVAKYTGAGNSFSPWGTYDTGIYKQYLPSGYVAPTSASVPASAGQSSATTGSDIQLTSFNPADILDPFQAVQDAAQSAGKAIASLVTNPGSVAEGLSTFAKDFNALASVLNAVMTDALWLFKPSHWVRIFCFWFGVGALLPGVWMLSKAGQGQGDATLALGIFLVVAAGCLLFLAFHSLPDDVTNIGDLLAYLSSEIRGNSPATTATINTA